MIVANKKVIVFILLLLAALPALAQAPSAHWKTVNTEHFRVHYPVEYEEWAMRAASHIESIRAAVAKEVGYSPKTVTDVIVSNPVADPNGVTLPLIGHPRILLYTDAPDPDLTIGEFHDWIDLLVVHEMTHLVHLIRPSRNPLQRIGEKTVIPLNPITLSAPRWAMEGYATVVEGRLTGSGRPGSSIRAAILRKWAASGRMPTYSQLASDRQFMGMSMAYLAGSAYLEWLEERSGAGSLRKLWARLTARQKRDFDTAFEGVFGDSPRTLYGLFVADLTRREGVFNAVEGDLWLDTKRESGEPAVSPDGSQIALVERNDKGESKIAVYSTGPNEEEKKYEERIAKMLKRDPEDVAPVRTKPLPRKPKHTLQPIEGGDVMTPRWAGTSIVYAHRQPDADGFLHNDLFIWNPETGVNRRITHLADVRDADPMSPGTAIAVRSRFGRTNLVKVDLATGNVTDYTPPSIDRVVTHPRASADGRIAWSEHDTTGWHIMVDGNRAADGFNPEWGRDGALYSAIARNGFIDIARNGQAITRTLGAAIQPAPAPDGAVYFMSMETDGYTVRRILPRPATRGEGPRSGGEGLKFEAESVSPKPYALGRQEPGFLFGGSWTAYQHSTEAGVRLGDVVGRLDTLLIGSTGDDRGVALTSAWRGWPVTLAAHAFRLRDDRGIEVRAEREYYAPTFTAKFAAGTSSRAFGSAAIRFHQRKNEQLLRAAIDSDHHWRAAVSATTELDDFGIALSAEAGRNLVLGGFASSVVPQSLRIGRVDDPALPLGVATSTRFRSGRAALRFGDAISLFWRRYDTGQTIDVRGLEIAMSMPPLAIVKSAGVEFTAGAAKVSDTRGIKGWIAVRWRP